MQVLVVDDDPDIREYFSVVLREMDIEFTTAASGMEALEICKQQQVKLVISDGCMPGMDGGELARCLRNMDLDIKVIAFSGNWDFFTDHAHFFDQIYHKPHDLTRLIKDIKNLVAST